MFPSLRCTSAPNSVSRLLLPSVYMIHPYFISILSLVVSTEGPVQVSVLGAPDILTHEQIVNAGNAAPMLLMDSVLDTEARQMQLLLWG